MKLITPDFGRNALNQVTQSNESGDYVTLAQAKLWCKANDDEDALIQGLIDDAVRSAEQTMGRSLISKRYTAIWDSFSADVRVPFTPVSEIVSIHRLDRGEEIEVTAYYRIGDSLRFDKVYGYSHPYYQQGLKVVYDAGIDDVSVTGAIKQMILTNYEDRQDNADNIMEVPSSSRKKLIQYKRYVN